MTTTTRGARVLAYLTFVAVLVIVAGVFWSLSRTNAIADGNTMAACRGGYSAEMMVHVVEVVMIQSEGLEAVVLEDDAKVADAISRLRAEREATRDAQADYLAASARSQDDPGAFLDKCKERD